MRNADLEREVESRMEKIRKQENPYKLVYEWCKKGTISLRLFEALCVEVEKLKIMRWQNKELAAMLGEDK